MNATHASFFSGAGGLDLGLERAGWRTVSFSEIDPYASAVLAQRWPGVPNLGSIVGLADRESFNVVEQEPTGGLRGPSRSDSTHADLWSGGFPCQDLSVAGKRRGMGAGTRSGLAYSFLALAERHRPRFILLENVPGLLSSHSGRDFGALLAALVELGYGVGYRVLDARYFGVPQRRRRVFILGDSLGGRAGAERAAEVLSVGSRCHRHPPTGIEAGPGVADRARPGVDIARAVTGTSGKRHDDDTDTLVPDIVGALNDLGHHGWTANAQSVASGHVISEKADSRGVRAPDGLAGRSHDRQRLVQGGEQSYHQRDRVYGDIAPALDAYGDTPSDAPIVAFTKSHNVAGPDDPEVWKPSVTARTMNSRDGDYTTLVMGDVAPDPLLPLGLDSHRYRCCGNGVVADVGEWIGRRLLNIIEAERAA